MKNKNSMNICFETKVEGYDAIMIEDADGESYTMFCYKIKGGAIVTAKTKEECLENFKEAMSLIVQVMKLMEFTKTGTFNYKNS